MPIINWYSRYVLNWALSTTMDADFCIVVLNEVLGGSLCEILIQIKEVNLPPPY